LEDLFLVLTQKTPTTLFSDAGPRPANIFGGAKQL